MKVYIMVTQDEFELPVAIADTVTELSKIAGVHARTIYSSISYIKTAKEKLVCIKK